MKKRDWILVVKGRKSSLFRSYALPIGACKNMKSLLGKELMSYPVFVENMIGAVYIDKEEVGSFGELILNKIKKDYQFPKKHLVEFEKRANQLLNSCEDIPRLNLKELSQKDLLKIFVAYTESYEKLSPFMATPHFFQVVLEDKIKELISYKNFENNLLLALTVPSKETFETVYQKELLKLSIKFTKDKNRQIIKKFIKKWAWIAMDDYLYDELHEKDIIEAINGNLGLNENTKKALIELENNQKNILKKARSVIRTLNLNEEQKFLIDLLQEYIWLRTERLKTFRKGFFYTKPLLEEISRRAALVNKEIYCLTPQEIIDYLKNSKLPSRKLLKERSESYVFAVIDGKNHLYSGKEWIEKFERLMGLKNNKVVKIIKGRAACLGKAEGKVKIVLSKEEIDKVKKGDILVTTMTSPDYVMAMRKASAIVTDEGGVTCHAAIVSRELGVPCIVGTGNATEILKEGDLVKVDANKGIVEKIQD